MSQDPEVLQLLGRIDGKLDQVIDAAREHREDDKRRFSDVYSKLGEHDQQIAKAQGAKGAILWVFSLVAGSAGALLTYVLKLKG